MMQRLGLRFANDADAVAEGAPPRWELVPSCLGSGVWLVLVERGAIRAWAPPGIRLLVDEAETLARWRRAVWSRVGEADVAGEHPTGWGPCTLRQVVLDVPADYEAWALEATEEAIDLLELFADGAPHGDSEAEAGAEQARVLQEEVDQVRAGSIVNVIPLGGVEESHLDASAFVSACRALSDCDFSRMVSDLIGAEWDVRIEHRQGALGNDVLVGEVLGRRHVFHVSHDPRALRWTLDAFPPPAHDIDDRQQDVRWWVTSQAVDTRRLAVEPPHRGGVIGAAQLQAMLQANPLVAREQLKLRLAGARAIGTDVHASDSAFSADLPQLAQTEVLREAREHLRRRGALVISGCSGSGKTTLGHLLLGEAALDGYAPFPSHGNTASERTAGRAVLIDDVPDPAMLLPWIHRAARSDDVLLVAITDREPPRSWGDFTLRVGHYNRLDRSRIIYNQLWPMLVRQPAIASGALVAACQALLALIDFTPRIAINQLRALFRNASDGLCVPAAPKSPAEPSEDDDNPFLSRLRRGWVGGGQ